MRIVVLADETQRTEMMASVVTDADVTWISEPTEFLNYRNANVAIDLLFVNDRNRRNYLMQSGARAIIVNSVVDALSAIDEDFVRINGWPTFLSSSVVEASAINEDIKQPAEQAFAVFGKKMEWLPDEPGFVTARVVSMIINEAFIALSEGVSTREETNTAMKLGTAYPYGPFEWAEKIGVKNIVALLKKLSETQPRYKPSELLLQVGNETV